jgi:uncharacterized heparinase superfamily protein
MRPVLRGILPSLLLAVAIAGCGGSASAKPGGSSGAKPASFTAHANAIRGKAAQRARQLKAPKTVGENAAFLESAHEILGQAERELRTLSAPAASRNGYRLFLASLAREVGYVATLARAVHDGDRARYRATTAKMAANTGNRQASVIGLTTCASTVRPQGK